MREYLSRTLRKVNENPFTSEGELQCVSVDLGFLGELGCDNIHQIEEKINGVIYRP